MEEERFHQKCGRGAEGQGDHEPRVTIGAPRVTMGHRNRLDGFSFWRRSRREAEIDFLAEGPPPTPTNRTRRGGKEFGGTEEE